MQPIDNYRLLLEKLDDFIRKYYVNQLIRGTLYATGLILLLFLGINLLEYFYYFGTGVRKFMFYSFLGVSAVSLIQWVILPLIHYFRLGKLISHEQAAQIIGNHFSNVKDKLLNVLQLKNQADSAANQQELILASINQKSDEIKLVPFQSAINLSQNRRYLRYALPPLLLLLILLFAAPSIIRDGAFRLIHNNQVFEQPAPFSFTIDNKDLKAVQFSDFTLKVKVDGAILPNEVFIDIDNYQYRLNKEDNNNFTYKFSNVQKDIPFKLFSGKVNSKEYTLDVLQKPNIVSFNVNLHYPGYIGRTDEGLSNVGDLVVPAGTNIDWEFNAQYTDHIYVQFAGQPLQEIKRTGDEYFNFKKRAGNSEPYKLYVSNAQLPNADSVGYTLTVIPDLYPTINVEKFEDSTTHKVLFFVGDASDDYGLRNLSFNYSIRHEDGSKADQVSKPLSKPDSKQIQYNYTWDLNDLQLKPGDEVSYFFEVFDNDGVNGSKSARTNLMTYNMPTEAQFEQMAAQNNDDIKKQLKDALKESKKIQDEMQKMRDKLLQQKDVDWQTKKELEKLVNRQKELQKQMEQAKDKFQENLNNQDQFSKTDESIQKKQEQVQKLMEEMMTDEQKKLMEQIQDMMQQLEKENTLDMMKDFQYNDEKLEKELDRMLELFKQLEVENEAQKQADKLEELSKQQDELSKQTEKNEKPQDELQKKQDEISKEFDKVQEKMDEIDKKNKELEHPMDLNKNEELQKDIDKDMKDSKEGLEKKQNNKASKSQKQAAKKMEDMAQEMKNSMQGGAMEQMEEDMKAMRQLLENLVNLSFDQEALMGEFNKTSETVPRYVKLVQQQYKLKDDFGLIQDSLQALSKRNFQLESFITDKVTEIKAGMRDALTELEDRKKPTALNFQQRTMKSVNDLALMLSEAMQQMQQQMSSMMPGNQSCKKPGGKGAGGGVPKDKISQGQQELNDQMKQMQDQLKKGKGMSKEFAQMAAKQAALRNALREKQKELQQKGQGNKELDGIQDLMDKVETELVNKQLSNDALKRVQDIETRLLESERAEREREFDNKRKAQTARDYERKMPPSLQEYIKKRESEIEMFKTVSPSLKPYYKQLVEEYFKTLKAR